MKTVRILYYLALADFFERARRYRFFLTLAVVVFIGMLVNNGTMGMTVGLRAADGTYIYSRGEFNPAWIGAMTVMVINSILSLFGFYLVSDCIQRDVRTGVGQIIATTPLKRATYLVGKWLSNCLVLYVLVLILAAAALIMVLLKHEAALDLIALLMPFLAVTLPYMALVAACAVLFETIPWLRGAFGNTIYFFLWSFGVSGMAIWGNLIPFIKDPVGYNVFSPSMIAAAQAAFPNLQAHGLSIGVNDATLKVFSWPGLTWTPGLVAGQWLWAVIGLGLVLLSSAWFARFDPSREGLRLLKAKPEETNPGEPAGEQKKSTRIPLHVAVPSLSPLISRLAQVSPFLGVLLAELRMLLNGRRWWWWLIMVGLNIAVLSDMPVEIEPYVLPLIWLWPLPIWSQMGNRERKNNTSQMVFSSARPVQRQLPAAWLAGILVTALLVIACAAAQLSNGDLPGLIGWIGAVVFIPSLALALGVSSSGSRVFEVVYLIWWYSGLLQKIPGMDFTNGVPQFYLLGSAALLLLAAFWRGRQVRV